jgi:hypothetical protein
MDGKGKMQGCHDGNDGASGENDGEVTVVIKSTKMMMTTMMAKRRRRRRRQEHQGYNVMDDTMDNPTIAFVDEADNNSNGMVDRGIVSKEERVGDG